MFYRHSLYVQDIAIIKKFRNDKYKLTLHKYLRQKGFEVDSDKQKIKNVNDEKLDCNIARARAKIFEYAICNDWDWFVNLTLDARKYDRFNLKGYIKDLTQWLRDYNKKHDLKIKYLFIPEQHQDGAWHIHGLLMGLPERFLSKFIPGKHPQKLIDVGYLNWLDYYKKFGYVSVGRVGNHEAVSKYLTKYVSKDMANNNRELKAHLYYCSNGLKKAEEIERGVMYTDMTPDYENDYVKIKWFSSLEEAKSYIR